MIAALAILLAGASAPVSRTLSVYHPKYIGRTMANGQPYDPDALTVASNDWKLGTLLRITCPRTGVAVTAKVTDKMAKSMTRKRIDASQRVWDTLTDKKPGLEPVVIRMVNSQ